MRIVIAGATGTIGSSLVDALLATDHEPVGIARRLPERRDPRVRWHRADVSTPEGVAALRGLLRGADAYVHLAWPLQPMRRPDHLRRSGPEAMIACVMAALDAGVESIVHLSSVAAYSPASRPELVDERWPLGGAAASTYARHKSEGEQRLHRVLAERSAVDRVTILRPCLVAQRTAAGRIARSGLPFLVPGALVDRVPAVPVVPVADGFTLQMVHADDVATATVAALGRRACGSFNIAGDGVVTGRDIAAALGARAVPAPSGLVRGAVAVGWHTRLAPLDPTWIDMAAHVPLMSTTHAREVLGWRPRHDAGQVLEELVAAVAEGAGGETPALRARSVRQGLVEWARRGSVVRRPLT